MESSNPNNSKESFETLYKQLEEIVAELEQGNLPLELSLGKYQEGIRRLKQCYGILDEVEKKIVLLSRKEDGSFEEIPFERAKNSALSSGLPSEGGGRKTSSKNSGI